jgi:hypothetical protein
MNSQGNIRKALKQFQKDLQDDPDYKVFKENAHIVSYDESMVNEYDGHILCRVMSNKTVTTDFNVPQVDNKVSRKLNKQLLK